MGFIGLLGFVLHHINRFLSFKKREEAIEAAKYKISRVVLHLDEFFLYFFHSYV
jgi:hypothetical protein